MLAIMKVNVMAYVSGWYKTFSPTLHSRGWYSSRLWYAYSRRGPFLLLTADRKAR
jgi:hypothetical protein